MSELCTKNILRPPMWPKNLLAGLNKKKKLLILFRIRRDLDKKCRYLNGASIKKHPVLGTNVFRNLNKVKKVPCSLR